MAYPATATAPSKARKSTVHKPAKAVQKERTVDPVDDVSGAASGNLEDDEDAMADVIEQYFKEVDWVRVY